MEGKIKEEVGEIDLALCSGSLKELLYSITEAIQEGATEYKVELLEDAFFFEWHVLKLFGFREQTEEEMLAQDIKDAQQRLTDLQIKKAIIDGRKLHGH